MRIVEPPPPVGISGGLFALVGAMLAQGVLHWRRIAPPARRMFVRGPTEVVLLVLGAIAGLRPEVLEVIAPRPRTPWRDG